jgi:hypothetical protein
LYLYPKLSAAEILRYFDRGSEALPLVNEALEIEPDSSMLLREKSVILASLDRGEEARALIRRLEGHVSEKRLSPFLLLLAEHRVSRASPADTTADALLARILEVLTASAPFDWVFVPGDVVPVLAEHGKRDDAVLILERCFRAGVVPPYDWLVLPPRLRSLVRDPRLEPLLKKSHFNHTLVLDELHQAQKRGELPPYLDRPLSELVAKLRTESIMP